MDKTVLLKRLNEEIAENNKLRQENIKLKSNQNLHDSIINTIKKVIQINNKQIKYYRNQHVLHPFLSNNLKRTDKLINSSISDNTKISQIGNMLAVSILDDIYGLDLKVFSQKRIRNIIQHPSMFDDTGINLNIISSSATVKDLINRITFLVKPTMCSPGSITRRKERLKKQKQSELHFP